MTDMIPMQKLLDAAAKEYPSLTRSELTDLIGLQIEVRQQQVKDEMKRIGKAKGGNISGQMEMFEDGGLKDEGNTVDPISGNDVPPGSTQEEVRDDIPAQLSEGEFVFPADVVRYIGLEKLMMMRQEAKQGLKAMEDMGQMGNSDEATMPDDLPFDMTDLDMDEDEEYNSDEKEMAEGGVIHAATGFAGTTTATQQLGSRASNFGNTATRTQPTKKYTPPPIPTAPPVGGFKYGSQEAAKKGKLSFDQLFKEAGAADEYRTYVNDAGAEIQVPFKNGKVMTGFTIPEGYKPKTEKVDTAKTQSTGVKSTRPTQEDSGDPAPSLTEQGFREGSNITFMGGVNKNGRRVDGGVGQKIRDIGVILDIPGGIAKLGGIPGALMAGLTGNYPKGTKMGITIKGDPNKIKYVTPAKYKELMEDPNKGNEFLNQFAKERSIEDDVKSISQQRRIDDKLTEDKDFMKSIADVPKGIREDAFTKTAPKVDTTTDTGTYDPTGGQDSGSGDMTTQSGRDSTYGDAGSDSDEAGGSGNVAGDSAGAYGGIGDFNIGGLAGKKKTKVKKMKRGGLASKK